MFFRNIFRPAFATAGANSRNAKTVKNDTMTYDTGAQGTDEFGAFTSSAPKTNTNNAKKRPGQPGKKKPGKKFTLPAIPLNLSSLIIAIAALLVVILIVVLVVVGIVNNRNKDITFNNNAYVSYSDPEGTTYVAVNGSVVYSSENEVELRIADDNSFAYIIDTSEDGSLVYVVKKGKPEALIGTHVDKILATASLEIGVVWLDVENGIYVSNDDFVAEKISGKDHENEIVEAYTSDEAYNYLFYISADASTVSYAKYLENGDYNLMVWKNGDAFSAGKLRLPAGLSDNGSYIYSSGVNKDEDVVFYIQATDDITKKVLVAKNFGRIIATNVAGNEVLYTVVSDDGAESTYLYKFNPKTLGDGEEEITPTKIGNGIFTPVAFNNNIARFRTLLNKYYNCVDGTSAATYYVNDSLERKTLSSKNSGKFDPNGKVFYYVSNSGSLMWIELGGDTYVANRVADDVVDFEVTSKGNVYYVTDGDRTLMFYNRNKNKATRIQYSVDEISMHTYSNTLYFTTLEGTEDVYSTKEGSDETIAKFGNDKLVSVPYFTNGNLKSTFAATWDPYTAEWKIFYTKNGKSFSHVGNTTYVNSTNNFGKLDESEEGNG